MSKLITIASTYNPYVLALPLWHRINQEQQQSLIDWQKRHYPRRPLHPPEKTVRISEFNPAVEMSKPPESSEHMRR